MEKPKYLYHGSCKGIEGNLVPRASHGDINGEFPEGSRNVVFATDKKELAALYTLKTKHMLSASNSGMSGEINIGLFRDYEGWKNELKDTACKLYSLPSESFSNTINKTGGHPSPEWLSEKSVTPAYSERYTPEMVMNLGVQLFFLDKKISGEMWQYNPHKEDNYSFMNRLEAKRKAGILPEKFSALDIYDSLIRAGVMTHLNSQTGIKPVKMEKSSYSELIKDDVQWLIDKMQEKNQEKFSWTTQIGAIIRKEIKWLQDIINPQPKENWASYVIANNQQQKFGLSR